MKKLLPGIVVFAVSVVTGGCHGRETPRTTAIENAQARVVASVQQQLAGTLRATGTVHAKETAIVSAQVMGRIEQVLVHEGDTVRAGQTLVVLDAATLRAQSAQAQAAIVAAQSQEAAAESSAGLAASTLARYKQLEMEKSVSPQEMDEVVRRAEGAEAQLKAARAQTEAARQQAGAAHAMEGYSRLTAPFPGVVTARMADPGTMAAPGVPLLQVDRTGALQLQATIDESAIAAPHVGMKTPVMIDGIVPAFEGTVAEILPAADAASHSFTAKIDLPSTAKIHAGVYGTMEIPNGTSSAITVPRSAVVRRGSLDCAYVLDAQNIAQLRYLTLGSVHGGRVEVLSGISAGERIVDTPGDRELGGKRIVAEQADAEPIEGKR
jgi:RND family efflux transporter MFP subunit